MRHVVVVTASLALWAACSSSTPNQPSAPTPPVASSSAALPVESAPIASASTPAVVASAPAVASATAPKITEAPIVDLTEALKETPFAQAITPVKEGKWTEVNNFLEQALPTRVPHVPKYVGMAALALNARALKRLGKDAPADVAYMKVVHLSSKPDRATEQDENATRQKMYMASAEGEARFYVAEKKRAEAEAIKPPAIPNGLNKDAMLKFINTKFVEWVTKRRAALEEAEKYYMKVLEVQPAPPPQWVIASAERVAHMWWSFVQGLMQIPNPKEWNQNPDMVKTYRAALERASEPYKQRSRSAYEMCQKKSEQWGAVQPHTQQCIDWLGSHRVD